MSANCRSRQDQPNARHHCTGCDCTCHHKVAPRDFRALVEAAKPAEAEPEAVQEGDG